MSETVQVEYASSSHKDWHSINWLKVNQTVKKLQIRIVKAEQEGKYRKVKSLQHLLTHSYSAKALSVRRVTENRGKRTSGIDCKLWSTPDSKTKAIQSLKSKGYKPKALKRVYLTKKNGKKRPLGIPTMKDRAMQSLYKFALEPIAETRADITSYGFRPERSTKDAIEQCFIALSPKRSAQWILEADISGCFDNINHDWLIQNIPMNKKILSKWLKSGFIYNRKLFPTNSGTPQGGIISPILANMTLDGLDNEIRKIFKRTTTKGREAKINYIRYADDFVITGVSKEMLEKEIKPIVINFLKERGLTLSEEKTKITNINEGFDFLGVNLRKYEGKLLTKPSKNSIKEFLMKIREILKGNKFVTQEVMIKKLNPIISGWCQYHKSNVSTKTFSYVDHQIFKALWNWSKYRHNNKNRKWIKKKYFKTVGGNNWVFKDGNTFLLNARAYRIVRHKKINNNANPYSKDWEMYFEKRQKENMLNNVLKMNKLKHIWLSQNGRCIICQNLITKETEWDIHHIVKKVEGGGDNISNLVMLHPNCHRQVHNQNLKVVKPCS